MEGKHENSLVPIVTSVQIVFLNFCGVELGGGGGCLEDHRILNYSSLGTYRLGQGMRSLLIIHFCGIPLRQIIYTYVPVASLLWLYL